MYVFVFNTYQNHMPRKMEMDLRTAREEGTGQKWGVQNVTEAGGFIFVAMGDYRWQSIAIVGSHRDQRAR